MPERTYDLHGVRLAVSAIPAVHARLAGLSPPLDDAAPPDLRFELVEGAGDHPFGRPARARPVYDPPDGEVAYSDADDVLYLEAGPRLRVLCEPGAGRARVSALGIEEGDLWLLSHPLFTIPLAEMLKRRGLFSLHAGAVSLGGRALVLPGTSGAGKSTLTLALARAGFGFLGDDTLFLTRKGPRLLAFPDEFDLTDETVSFFPELARLFDAAHPWKKRQLRAEEAYGAPVVWEAEPGLLVFPHVSGVRESVLTPIGRDEALLELAPNVLLTEPVSSQAHLDVLAELVERSDCYRLATGSDLGGAVQLLRELM